MFDFEIDGLKKMCYFEICRMENRPGANFADCFNLKPLLVTGSEVLGFQDQDIPHPPLGQKIRRRRARNAAPDNDSGEIM
jgi:hypothetical protein